MSAPPGDEPHARGTLVAGAVASVRQIWGEPGLKQLRESLSPEVASTLFDRVLLPMAWYPESHFESCCEIVWRQLAREDDAAFFRFIHASIDSGWTIVHRALMRLATPQRLARRAPDLWRHDHTHGELLVDFRQTSGTVRIKGYPYPRSSIMHHGQAEALRHILTHARVRDVRATRHLDVGDDFVVTFDWT